MRGDGHVSRALDESPKAVVVTLLRAGRGRHGHDHRPFSHAAQLVGADGERPSHGDSNSLGKVPKVRTDSLAISTRP